MPQGDHISLCSNLMAGRLLQSGEEMRRRMEKRWWGRVEKDGEEMMVEKR